MGTQGAKERMHKRVKDEILPGFGKLGADTKDAEARLLKVTTKLADAMKRKDGHDIQLYQKALKVVVGPITNLFAQADEVADKLVVLQRDDDFTENLDEIDRIGSEIDAIKKRLAGKRDAANQMIEKASKDSAALVDGDAEVREPWAVFESKLRKLAGGVKANRVKLLAKKAEAQKAHAARDAARVAVLQREGLALREAHLKDGKEMQDSIKAFVANVDPKKLSPALQSEWTRQQKVYGELDGEFFSVATNIVTIWVHDFKDLRVAPIDAAKAAKSLGIDDPAQQSKVAAALVGDDAKMTANLGKLAKELKLKTNGKDMLAKLRRDRAL